MTKVATSKEKVKDQFYIKNHVFNDFLYDCLEKYKYNFDLTCSAVSMQCVHFSSGKNLSSISKQHLISGGDVPV